MKRSLVIAAVAAGVGALVAGVLADAAGLEGWAKTILTAAAAGLGALVGQMVARR